MNLSDLLYRMDNMITLNPLSFEISKLCTDSRKAVENSVFFALKGEKFNAEEFATSAVMNGAKAIVVSKTFRTPIKNITIIKTDNVQRVLNQSVEFFYKDKIPHNLYAVTGTNGKTSVANFTAQILEKFGKNSAAMGTLGTLLGGDFDRKFNDSGMTTPDIVSLFEDLRDLKNKNIEDVVMEASSHGLHQERLGFLKFKAAGFTNFTQDHLDYHKTMEEYFKAKMLLFKKHLTEDGVAVVNSDIPEFEKIKEYAGNILEYGRNSRDLIIENIKLLETGSEIRLNYRGKSELVKTNLIGKFQASNLACAIGLLLSQNYDFSEIVSKAEGLNSVRGRMELIPMLNGKAKVVIDYAHTPDALEKAIHAVRAQTFGRVITLFGCGGDRDKTKRPLMGKISSELSDMVIVTDDNPRTENAASIRKEIIVACPDALEIADRAGAIKHGIQELKEGDCLLIAGKGHEDYQIIGMEKLHFSDREEVLGGI